MRTRALPSLATLRTLLALALLLALAPAAPADTLLVANKAEATLSLVDLASGEVVATLPTGDGPHEVDVSPDGKTAVVANYFGGRPGHTLTVVDVPGAKVLRTLDLGELTRPHGIVFIDAQRVVVTCEGAGSVAVVNVKTGEVERRVATGQEVSHMVAVPRDGKRAYVANIGSGSMTVIDLAKGTKVGDVATGGGAEGVAVTPDGRWVWVSNRAADTVSLVDAKSLEKVADLPSASFPIRAEVTPDGKWVLVTNAESGTLTVIDAAERKVARTVDLGQGAGDTEGKLFGEQFGDSSAPIGIEIARDGKTAWIAHANADVVQVVDLTTWKPSGVLRAGREPDGMAYSPLAVGERKR